MYDDYNGKRNPDDYTLDSSTNTNNDSFITMCDNMSMAIECLGIECELAFDGYNNSDDIATEGMGDVFSAIGKGIAEAWKKFIDLCKKVLGAIRDFLSKFNLFKKKKAPANNPEAVIRNAVHENPDDVEQAIVAMIQKSENAALPEKIDPEEYAEREREKEREDYIKEGERQEQKRNAERALKNAKKENDVIAAFSIDALKSYKNMRAPYQTAAAQLVRSCNQFLTATAAQLARNSAYNSSINNKALLKTVEKVDLNSKIDAFERLDRQLDSDQQLLRAYAVSVKVWDLSSIIKDEAAAIEKSISNAMSVAEDTMTRSDVKEGTGVKKWKVLATRAISALGTMIQRTKVLSSSTSAA